MHSFFSDKNISRNRLYCEDVFTALQNIPAPYESIDLIFADPWGKDFLKKPYKLSNAQRLGPQIKTIRLSNGGFSFDNLTLEVKIFL